MLRPSLPGRPIFSTPFLQLRPQIFKFLAQHVMVVASPRVARNPTARRTRGIRWRRVVWRLWKRLRHGMRGTRVVGIVIQRTDDHALDPRHGLRGIESVIVCALNYN